MSGDDWLRHLNEEYAEESTANSGPEEQFAGADPTGMVQLALDTGGFHEGCPSRARLGRIHGPG